MVPVRSWSRLAGIRETQLGDARAHCEEGTLHCASADRVAGLAEPGSADAEAEDKEVAQSGLTVGDVP
jgi:hypothetical protein